MARAAVVLEQVIVKMNAVERGVGRTSLVQVAQIVVDEMASAVPRRACGRSRPRPPPSGHLPRLQ